MSKSSFGILLVHGFASTPDNFRELTPHIKALGVPYRLPTLQGHGAETSEKLRDVDWREWLADGENALFELFTEAEKAIVIGHSMGGWIALNLAVGHREKIDSIIIAGASTRTVTPVGPGRPLHFLFPLIRKLANKMDWIPVYTATELAQADPSYRWVPMEALAQLFDFMKVTQKRLSEVNIPILILGSTNDSMGTPEGVKRLYDNISTPNEQKQLIWFDKTDHFMFLDCEREEANRTVVEFVRERIRRYEYANEDAVTH
jgi:carboxylesterase